MAFTFVKFARLGASDVHKAKSGLVIHLTFWLSVLWLTNSPSFERISDVKLPAQLKIEDVFRLICWRNLYPAWVKNVRHS